MSLIRSISGIRGIIGKSLTPNVITEYVAGFSEIIPEGKVVIGRDGRPSGCWIENIVVGTLLAMGRDVVRLGIVPTPTVQVLVQELKASGWNFYHCIP
jgi:Phosphomannomutase